MAKKRKKKKKDSGFDPKAWNLRELKELQKGKYMGLTQYRYDEGIIIGGKPYPTHKLRHRKFYVPKWIWKVKFTPLQSDYIDYHEKYGRFPNNEERILAKIRPFGLNLVKDIAKDTAIDYRNVSRYLNRMEKKGLIKIEPYSTIKTMKSGRLKTYHAKNVLITKKGKELYNERFGQY